MVRKIERDQNRFKQIVRGQDQGRPAEIHHPRRDDRQDRRRAGLDPPAADRDPRVPLRVEEQRRRRPGARRRRHPDRPRPATATAPGGAGDAPGHHILEVELTLDELAEILGEGLELPRIQPKGRANIIEEKDKYTGIRQAGPESLRHFKRTYKKALKRQIASNTYNPDDPMVIPVREDKLYRSWNPISLPHSNAVVLYLMDVSG